MSIDPSRPLRRNTRDAMIGGVCSGLADYLGWDRTLVRVLSVISIFITGLWPGVIAYIVMWIITPSAEAGPPAEQAPPQSPPPSPPPSQHG